ncbi:TY1B-PR1 [Symbiodinium sp. CCMP2592]|nr:TY1B-PR1 [Symbiodinium sp. CCMP2592]
MKEHERPKSSIGSVKIEEFHGERKKFRAWRRASEAQEHLYKLESSELAMLLYLSTRGEARDTLDQRPLSDYTAPGGLVVMWALLEETFGESNAESFERAEKELSAYRRLPGQSVASFVAGMKRLRMNYTVEDPDSTWSNKAWAQRLLNRAGLTRRDRLDVFYSAGGCYDTDAIERALRHRCSHVHEEERRVPFSSRSSRSTRSVGSSAASTASGSTASSLRTRSTRKHGVHVAGQQTIEEDDGENVDDEDLEQEEIDPEPLEYEEADQNEPDDGDGDQDSGEEAVDVFEAFQAGWQAKSKAGGKKKARGFRTAPSGGDRGGAGGAGKVALAQKKKSSTCASCGAKGHWRGDAECPNVQSGRDAPHRPGGTGGGNGTNEVNFVNFTFMVGSLSECPNCGHFCEESAAFCAKCGTRLSKRGWTVVNEPEPGTLPSAGPSPNPDGTRPMRLELPKAKKVRLKPVEVLGAVDQLSREEKKALKMLLQEEEEVEAAWASLSSQRPFVSESGAAARGSNDFVPPLRVTAQPEYEDLGRHRDRDQFPLRPRDAPRPPAAKDAEGRDKAKAVKQKELDDFRHDLYARQLQDRRCIPSQAAPRPNEKQARCRHLFGDLLWTANQHGHFARCAKCDLKHVIYYSVRHGVLMVNQGPPASENPEPPADDGPVWSPGLAVADTGCRTAVGGARWHEALQSELRNRGVSWQTVREREVFQFGSGPPVVSQRAFLYPVALVPGQVDVLRMSEGSGAAASCPGLVGPSELARWSVQFEFRTRELVIMGHRQPMQLTDTRSLEGAWSVGAGQASLAFVTGTGGGVDEAPSSASSVLSADAPEELDQGEDPRHWRRHHRQHREQEWLDFLQDDLGVRVIDDHRLLRDRPSADDADGDSAASTELRPDFEEDRASVTSHEFGVELVTSGSDTGSEEPEVPIQENHSTHFLHKGKRLNQASRLVREVAASPQRVLTSSPASRSLRSQRPAARQPGPWRVLEVFVCSMTVSLLAAAQGWTAGQPVASPGFELTSSADRREARQYVDRFGPDLLVVSWPDDLVPPDLVSYGTPTAARLHALQCHYKLAKLLFVSWPTSTFCGVSIVALFGTLDFLLLPGEWPVALAFVADGAGRWPRRWCKAVAHGAAEALCQRGRMLVAPVGFVSAPLLPEETFVEDDEEVLHDAPMVEGARDDASEVSEAWLDGLDVDRGDFHQPRGTAQESVGNHGDLAPNDNNSNPDGGSQGEVDGTHGGHAPDNNNSNPDGGSPSVEQLRDLLSRGRRDVPKDLDPPEAQEAAVEPGSKLERLHLVHRRLGHPTNENLVRLLQMGGASDELLDMARNLKCPLCQMRKQPIRPLPARPGSRPIAFNYEVHLDLKYIKDAGNQLYVALSMVDAATCFHAARLLRCRDPSHVAAKFMSGWLGLFGIPVAIVLDQGGEFETEFIALLESHSIASKVTGSYAPWQNGFCERQGALLGVACAAAVEADKAEGRAAMKAALACALQAKNSTVSRRGHSAHQLVFGRQAYLPELLDEEVWSAAGLGQALSVEGEVARMAEMRAAARVALLHGDVHEKLKAALRRAPGGQSREFAPGEMVFFWSPAADFKRRRYRKDAGAWRGPAVILMPDGSQKYFVSWRGRCLLVAAANLKVASLESADDHDLRLREAEAKQDTLSRAPVFVFGGGGTLWDGAFHLLLVGDVFPEPEESNDAGPPPAYADSEVSPSEMDEEEMERLLEVPLDSRAAQEDRRAQLLDDLPEPVRAFHKRKQEQHEQNLGDPDGPARKKMKDVAFVNYVLAAISEGEILKTDTLKNEWLGRAEVDYLSQLLDVPLSSVRVHRAPRKRLQAPGGNKNCARLTVMVQKDPSTVMVAAESPNEEPVARENTGLRDGSCLEPVFVEKEGAVYQAGEASPEVLLAAAGDLQESALRSEAFLLRLKANGKELDPRYFSSEEAKAFDASDAVEWQAWEKNNVVRKLSAEQARRVPSHRIFKVPARIVRTNKAAVGSGLLQPKSRIVLPGHMDPDVGEVRTDSPTTQATAVRMAMTLCVTRRWLCYLFDVSTAFLSGKEVGRELYVRPPRDLKGTGLSELWLILRSAYGLAEAPRLWYERAKELLSECGFEELPFALCTFVWRDPKSRKVLAVLCLHVDDGMLVADVKLMDRLKSAINDRFQIKVWNLVQEVPLDYLGLKIYMKNGIFFNDMTAYVLAIQPPDLSGLKKGQVLKDSALKAFRRLVAQLRWPAHHVLPEFLFEVSALAQQVSKATKEDLKEGVALLERFHQAAKGGRATLAFPPVGEDPVLVTFFDASLGKTGSAAAQRGEVHFIADKKCLREPASAAILEFHSCKISRVVRSSMSAECCSMAAAADKLLYNQKLFDALWFGHIEVGANWRRQLQVPGHLVTDAKSLYDHAQGTSLAAERQTALDILAVRQLIQEGTVGLHWVPTWRQFADGLTKAMADLLFDGFRKARVISLRESETDRVEEERRAGIRRGQRERRKARMKDAGR